jgi:hypothetical protein
MANPRNLLSQQETVDNLTSTSSVFPLSANQGRILNNRVSPAIYNSVLKTTTLPIFTFPSSVATDLSIYWSSTLLQPILTNNASGETVYYTFRAIWDIPSQQGYPARHYQASKSLVGISDAYFTNTNAPISGLELDLVPSNIDVCMQIGNNVTGENTSMNFTILLDAFEVAPTLEFVSILGYFREITPDSVKNFLKIEENK